MKKFYSILLTVTLFISILTVTASASFTDNDSIGALYSTAVETISATGIIAGFEDGSFRPNETLTREQGAKIVAYIVLGESVKTLASSKTSFEDVFSDRWSSPYIAWCADQGILLGYGNGKFGPADTLTGYQFAKVLLCSLKLSDGNYSGLGAGWIDKVYSDGNRIDLFRSDDNMATDSPITRQQAALLAYNAINASKSIKEPLGYLSPLEYRRNKGLIGLFNNFK